MQFLIIKTDTNTHDASVLGSFYSFEMALNFVNDYLNNNYSEEQFQKLHDNKNSVSVFKYCRLWGKTLLCKIQIREYDEK